MISLVRWLTVVVLVVGSGGWVHAQNRLRVALEESSAWSVSGTYVHTTLLESDTWIARGEASWRQDGEQVELFVEGVVTAPDQAQTRYSLRGGRDGWKLVDETNSTWIGSPSLSAPGPMQDSPGALLAMLALPIFDAAAGEGCAEVDQRIDFGGVECTVIGCQRGDSIYVWYADARDGRPRFVERTTEVGAGERRIERLTLTQISALDPTATIASLSVPADYVKLVRRGPAGPRAHPTLAQVAFGGAKTQTEAQGATPTSLAQSTAALVEAFNAGIGRPRVIGLFAPS